MTSPAAHKWAFAPRFRRHAFGWRSQPAVQRVREAAAEIHKVAKKDPALAAAGAVLFLEKVSPALEQVDSSSGAIGTAVNHAIDRQGPDRRVAGNTNDPVCFMRRPLYGACPPQPPISPVTRCSHENFATVSVPKQCSSPAPKAKRNLIIDAMAIFAGQ